MSLAGDLWGLRCRAAQQEWLDDPNLAPQALARNLAEIAATNRALGWTRLTLRYLERLTVTSPGRTLAVLDAATGAGDVPLAVARWARRRGLPITVTAVDVSPAVLEVARHACAGYPEITLLPADALALPFAPAAFDVALCSLALHHFAPPEAVALLGELARVSRAIVAPDLERSALAYLGARALTLLWRSPLTRHDGPLSVRRAYTPTEARGLLRRAGLSGARVRRHFPCRMVLLYTDRTAASLLT